MLLRVSDAMPNSGKLTKSCLLGSITVAKRLAAKKPFTLEIVCAGLCHNLNGLPPK